MSISGRFGQQPTAVQPCLTHDFDVAYYPANPLFLSRDITRHDVRELVRLGLAKAGGSYRNLLTLFGMDQRDYKRFLNFLAAHDCGVDFRLFRESAGGSSPSRLLS